MPRLGLLVALLHGGSACDTAASFDITPLTGVYAGLRTVDVLAVDPESGPATIRVTADEAARTVQVTVSAEGDSPVVVRGTYAESGTLTASNTMDASRLPIEFVVDPSGTLRGTYSRLAAEPGASVTGAVEGTWTPEAFLLTLVEPDEGGVRVEYRTFR
jgi:hypothetical protein